MIITKNWLSQFLDLTNISDDMVSDAFNNLGLEVEEIHNYNENTNLLGGRIDVVNTIEGSDHLHFCLVDTGHDLVDTIVCGAGNVREGMYVVVAPVGSKLANGLTMSQRNIKNKISMGMMCALNEVGIIERFLTTEEKDGIIDLVSEVDASYTTVGDNDVAALCNLNDVSYEVDLTLNRSDCLSAYEMARELSVYFKLKLEELSTFDFVQRNLGNTACEFVVRNDVPEISNIRGFACEVNENPKPLPLKKRVWLKMSQHLSDIKQVWVDLGTQATIETGQPLLCLDGDKLDKNLRFCTDYVSAEFNVAHGDLVLLSGDEYVATIGVKTNPRFAPTTSTKKLVTLAISVDFALMRKQQKRYAVSNIDMQRYIKPISPTLVDLGLMRFAKLLDEGNYLWKISDLVSYCCQTDSETRIDFTLAELNALLGTHFTEQKITGLLEPLGFVISSADHHHLTVLPPSTRSDVTMMADVAEEVARLYGYNNIKAQPIVLPSIQKNEHAFDKMLRDCSIWARGNGHFQVKTYSLTSLKVAEQFNFFNYHDFYSVASPMSRERATMRSSLLFGMLEVASYNNARGMNDVKLFALDKIYAQRNAVQNYHFCLVVQETINANRVQHTVQKNSFFYMKGLAEAFLAKQRIDIAQLSYAPYADANAICHPYQSAIISYRDHQIGIVGKIHPQYAKTMKIKPTFFCELDLSTVAALRQTDFSLVEKINQNNPIVRDITVLQGDTALPALRELLSVNLNHLTGVDLIDRYVDPTSNEVSLTFSLTFNDAACQLNDEKIALEWAKLLENMVQNNIVVK